MKKFTKVALSALSLASVAAISIAGTVAYLTDDEKANNVFTVGNVDIAINEYQRNEDGSALEDFEQGKQLMPIVGSAQADSTSSNMDKWGMPTAGNYGDKIVTVTNTGKSDAYVRIYVAKPAALADVKKDGSADTSDDVLHNNLGNRVDLDGDYTDATGDAWKNNWNWTYPAVKVFTATIDGQEYEVAAYDMTDVLKPGEESDAIIAGFYLDAAVDYDDETGKYVWGDVVLDYDFSKGVTVPVYAQAVQSAGFATAAEAFAAAGMDAALQAEWWEDVKFTTNASPESGAVRPAGYAPSKDGEVIDNLVIYDNSDDVTNLRALYQNGITGDLTITNSYLEGTYAMNVTAVAGSGAVLTVENSAFRGWVSFSGFASASFTNCNFGVGPVGSGEYNYIRTYNDTTLTNCDLAGTMLDTHDEKGNLTDATITLVNCTYNGEAITADMLADIVDGDSAVVIG